jgi:phosphoenolpyruvate synthase/pyruvate phosphate dikinase
MSARLRRLMPLGPAWCRAPVSDAATAAAGAKAARLSAALQAGLPVLPGWTVPSVESRPAVRAAAALWRGGQPARSRRAVLSHPLHPELARELRAAADGLGGRVIVRSSSRLEGDPLWSGAFSSVADVRPDEMVTAIRSCWASAFAVDPLARLESCGLPVEALELGVLIQPEIRPTAGGVARVITAPLSTPARGSDPTTRAGSSTRAGSPTRVLVEVEGVEGHPGPLLTGWADGASAVVSLPAAAGRRGLDQTSDGGSVPADAEGPLLDLIGRDLVIAVARLAEGVGRLLGDSVIEWAVWAGKVWLLQCRSGQPDRGSPVRDRAEPAPPPDPTTGPHELDLAGREWMPLLSAVVRARGRYLRGRPAVAGEAAGRLVACRPHERPPAACRDAIVLIDRPLPALAPLLFAARGVIARSGAASSHLAEVARSLSVPMVTGCRPETVTGAGSDTGWLAAIDGSTGHVALLPDAAPVGASRAGDGREARHE